MPIFLDTVEICNFKSFYGKTTINTIRSFTAIIGRNGSGKSNIIDAISFALGEEPSALRVKQLENLVHAEAIKVITYVKVIFKIDDGTKKSFARKIYEKKNWYEIDNEKIEAASYINELREMGLDIKTRSFLIPQGYIENIVMKMPKDLTTLFEKISNSNIYKAEYERLKLELLKAGDEIYFEHQMKKQVLIQKKCAAMEKEKAEKYLQLEKIYNKKKLRFQLIQLLLIKKEVESLQDEEKDIKLQVDEYLRDKKATILLLEHTKSQSKSLSSSLEINEQDILEMENIIRQRKVEHVILEEDISYWKKKQECARTTLDNAKKAHDTKERIIQELKDELKQINHKLTEISEASQTSAMELSNSQVKRYMELTNKVECQAKAFVKQITSLMRDQQENHDKLDNENRRKQELEDKVKQIRLTKEDLEMRLKRLEDSNAKLKTTLNEKTEKAQELSQKISDTNNKSSGLENDIAKISGELSQADIDNDTISRQIKKKETIKILKQLCPGVYGRISDLCKPIHSRYNVAITKVFGKNMDAIVVDTKYTATQCIQFLKEQKIGIEIFLPLDLIKKIVLKEQLRTIKEPKNVKLLYDLLNISSSQINKAVLFVAKNTLVCETVEDARKIAHQTDKQKAKDCVSLDGCFYRKDGTLSGGQADLIKKAKQWGEQEIVILQERKAQLMQEFRNLPKISVMQSELDIINVQIKQFKLLQNNHIEPDIRNTENEIIKINEELDTLDGKVIALNMAISEIQDNIQKQIKNTRKMKKHINAIKDEIFVDFCTAINVPNISYYEENNLRNYKEQKKRQMELEQQKDRIECQLCFENENDTKSKMLKWERAEEEADTKLNKLQQQERRAKIKIEREETKMSKLKDNYTHLKKDLENLEKKMAQHKSQIDVIGKLYLESQKEHIAVQRKIEQKAIECNTILKDCKIENFNIPMLEISHHRPNESFFTSSSSSNAESLDRYKVLSKIDFSKFPENICECSKEDLQDISKKLDEKLIEIRNEFTVIVNPNLKVDEKIDSIDQQLEKLNTNLRNCNNKCNKIKMQFESVKAERYKLFSDCLEYVEAEIDSTYKNLVNDKSAQAIIFTDNAEEPYAGNIIYNCIMPFKGFQPLQYLSGGEKSLASLALLFVILRYKRIPFLIMDEADASLDKTNIKNVIRFIQSQINAIQFITISLHKELYSNADILIGVTQHKIIERKELNKKNVLRSKVFVLSLSEYCTQK